MPLPLAPMIVKKGLKMIANVTLSPEEYAKFKKVVDIFSITTLITIFGLSVERLADWLGVDVEDLEAFLDFID